MVTQLLLLTKLANNLSRGITSCQQSSCGKGVLTIYALKFHRNNITPGYVHYMLLRQQITDPKLVMQSTAALTDPTKLATLKAYRLRADSPCIGAGLPIKDNGCRDFWGNKVLKVQKPTLGACVKP